MQKKRQHIIPRCYLKAWCDPVTPKGQTPYVWLISRDGNTKKRKSPEKTFTESDRYTIRLPHGGRGLVVENTLMQTENEFVQVLSKIEKAQNLDQYDRAHLCIFAAAMHSRSKAQGDHFGQFFGQLDGIVKNLEKKHGAEPSTSMWTGRLAEGASAAIIAMTLETLPPMLFRMKMAIVAPKNSDEFITSDTPSVWHDPEAYKRPPLYRSPGLAYPSIEITLPLSPRHLLMLTRSGAEGYVRISPMIVDELNRRTRFHCKQYFVSRTDETKPYWFDPGQPPNDSWENSEAGRQAIAEGREGLKKTKQAARERESKVDS